MSAETVLLADDHVPTRAGIRATLEDAGFSVVGEAGTAEAAVQLAREHAPDVVLLDVAMPGGGIAAAREVVEAVPHAAVVMLTVSRDDEDLFGALRAGASGYLLKDTDPSRLPFALRGVLAGEAALPRELVMRVLDEFRARTRRRRLPLLRRVRAPLTEREWEVLEMLAEDASTRDVARRLSISEVTVRRHVGAIVAKLEVADRDAAIKLVKEA